MSFQPRFSLRQLGYFLQLAESATLSEAAGRLNISQGALSESLRELEADLGLQLFVRRRALGITLTRPGRELLVHARNVLVAAEDFQARAQGKGAALAGRFTVGCYTTLAPFLMPKLMADCRAAHPQVEIELIEGSAEDLQQRLHDGRCDFAVLYDFDLAAETLRDDLYRVAPHVLLPRGHRLAGHAKVDLRRLAAEQLIQFALPPAEHNTQQIFDNVGVTPKVWLRTRNFELVRSLVARGLGYAVLLQRPPAEIAYDGHAVVARDIARLTSVFSVALARSPYMAPSQRLELFRGFCVGSLAAAAPAVDRAKAGPARRASRRAAT
ncbi:LysR family transcriptional regulator [Bradyrhizobium sp. U87765 SZCCT0131]|uniref:LysR substrate-binding domain-containing protein n=1 Tax=unclassified Bradyrhizobium TaxID=2631580 RepID=UPI001BABE775|nr:LysR family transcriptional regulator [Bradyrhizobium sp. U87765 SZCCT0131]MBR1259598.1 LysR family transcriptional regulator [Bradyrhizobium sp. U87765 SZCCT0134]MBR1305739.1 LysR family transcriptional regulator [Bradyrhizobium sp. U87765 SZCCT0110]MBR1322106.1 LysR family transcriptional regulator [Bradyrhizobium sp. U87765 SZCCT0109]MBR1350616.1 LysR family transcriptional regulator [Bradyrhizobium sp. U87765 SZCCT0048]